ncbi:hypothetical protein ACFVVX_36195 [Kitasatospora sp. NPDC058170]|uniref:hypothetical protein n=1 Tax=Kitasatospora sp. NPDC058170 TaxID=3346364 RepID=UPI0036DCE5D2
MKRIGVAAAASLSAAALLLAGCSGPGAPVSTASTSTVTTFGCLTEEQGRKGAVTVQDRGNTNKAYFQDSDSGGAEVALIFWHQDGGSLCDWVPYLGSFTKAGYAVLAFTSSGDFFNDLGPADHFLASKGFSKMVMVGASGTATALLDKMASPVDGPEKAVVALSAPQRSGNWDAAKMVALGKLPTFFAAEKDDLPSSGDAKALYDASSSPGKQLKIYPGARHGADLLKDGALPNVLAFLATYAPPKS